MINSGKAPIFENNLNDMIAQSVGKGKLLATEDINFLVIDRMGKGENLIIHKFEKEKIILNY